MAASCSPLQALSPVGTEEGPGDTPECRMQGGEKKERRAGPPSGTSLHRGRAGKGTAETSSAFGCLAWLVLSLVCVL